MEDFVAFGTAEMDGNRLKFAKFSDDIEKGIYALVRNGKIVYIGKFENGLQTRLSVISNPPQSQKTHYRLAFEIRQALKKGDSISVRVLYLAKESRVELQQHANHLIVTLAPQWNLTRKKGK